MLVTRNREIVRAYNAGFLDIRRQFRARFVSIVPEADACSACLRLEGDYPCQAVPPLPVVGCTKPEGCDCWYLALTRPSSRPSCAPPTGDIPG